MSSYYVNEDMCEHCQCWYAGHDCCNCGIAANPDVVEANKFDAGSSIGKAWDFGPQ